MAALHDYWDKVAENPTSLRDTSLPAGDLRVSRLPQGTRLGGTGGPVVKFNTSGKHDENAWERSMLREISREPHSPAKKRRAPSPDHIYTDEVGVINKPDPPPKWYPPEPQAKEDFKFTLRNKDKKLLPAFYVPAESVRRFAMPEQYPSDQLFPKTNSTAEKEFKHDRHFAHVPRPKTTAERERRRRHNQVRHKRERLMRAPPPTHSHIWHTINGLGSTQDRLAGTALPHITPSSCASSG
jgi:hypothetical protein